MKKIVFLNALIIITCPPNYKLITQKSKCIDECKNDNDNKYIFECISGCDSQCVEKCPTDLKIDYEEKNV